MVVGGLHRRWFGLAAIGVWLLAFAAMTLGGFFAWFALVVLVVVVSATLGTD